MSDIGTGFMQGVKRVECNDAGLVTAIEFYEGVNGNYIAQAMEQCSIAMYASSHNAYKGALERRKRFLLFLQDEQSEKMG